MNLLDNKLETLLAVNEYKSFTTASKILNLTQPAVSQHISMLEKEFGVKIFHKNGSSLVLTSEGEILVKYARRMKALSKELDNKIAEEKTESRIFKIGITHSLEGNMLPEVLANIAKEQPRTTIKIYSDSIKNLYDKLSSFEINLAVIEGKVTSNKFAKIPLDSDALMVVMSPNHHLAKKPIINLSDLLKEKIVFKHSSSATRSLFTSSLEQHDYTLDDLNILIEIDNTNTIKNLIMKNFGISILPRSVCLNEIKNKTLVAKPIENMNLTTEIYLVYNKNAFDEQILKKIMESYEKISLSSIK